MAQKLWTHNEEEYLKTWYSKKSTLEIAANLNRSTTSIHRKADRLGLHKGDKWSDLEIRYLTQFYGKKTNKELSKHLFRSTSAIQGKAQQLGLTTPYSKEHKPWTIEEEEYLEANYHKKSAQYISKKLNRSENSIKRKASTMFLSAYMNQDMHVKQVAYAFNCDSRVINRWIDKFDLPCKEFYRNTMRCRTIDSKVFWKWAYNHQDIIPWNKYERLSILPEPEWVKITVSNNYSSNHRKDISPSDISCVVIGRKKGESFEDIAKELNRTVESVKHIWRSNK